MTHKEIRRRLLRLADSYVATGDGDACTEAAAMLAADAKPRGAWKRLRDRTLDLEQRVDVVEARLKLCDSLNDHESDLHNVRYGNTAPAQPSEDAECERAGRVTIEAHELMRAERNAAIARAEAAESERDRLREHRDLLRAVVESCSYIAKCDTLETLRAWEREHPEVSA
jgi:hypothetical protein